MKTEEKGKSRVQQFSHCIGIHLFMLGSLFTLLYQKEQIKCESVSKCSARVVFLPLAVRVNDTSSVLTRVYALHDICGQVVRLEVPRGIAQCRMVFCSSIHQLSSFNKGADFSVYLPECASGSPNTHNRFVCNSSTLHAFLLRTSLLHS